MATNQIDLGATLLALTTNTGANPLPAVVPNPSEQNINVDIAGYRSKIQSAFPGQKVDIQYDPVSGNISGTIPDVSARSNPAYADPQFDPQKTPDAFAQIKDQLLNAKTNEEKLNLALNLKRLALDQQTFNYNKYISQAETKFGIPDIESAIQAIKQEEAMAPNRPYAGAISNERLSLLMRLGEARTGARQYTEELLKGDTVVHQANNLADSTLSLFSKSDDLYRLDVLSERKLITDAQKTELLADPARLSRIAALTTGNVKSSPEVLNRIAGQIASGKLALDKDILQLSNASPEDLRTEYLNSSLPATRRLQVTNALLAEEIAATGNEAVAREHIKVLQAIQHADFGNPKVQPGGLVLPPDLVNERNKKSSEMNRKLQSSGAGPKEKALAFQQLDLETKTTFLQLMTNTSFNGDVRKWVGVIQSDPAAKGIIDSMPKDKPISAQDFIMTYTNAPNDMLLSQKVATIRAMVDGAATASQRSVILPPPSVDNLTMLADKIAAQAVAIYGFNIRSSSFSDYAQKYRDATVLQQQRGR